MIIKSLNASICLALVPLLNFKELRGERGDEQLVNIRQAEEPQASQTLAKFASIRYGADYTIEGGAVHKYSGL